MNTNNNRTPVRQHTAHWISAHAPPNHADSDDALPAQRCHLLANTGNIRSYNISPETNRHCAEHSGAPITDGVRDDAADDDVDLHECMSAGSSSSEEECIKPPPPADSRVRAHPAHWYETPCSDD